LSPEYHELIAQFARLISSIRDLEFTERIDAVNKIRRMLHHVSPFKGEPVDCVLWVRQEEVEANDYNPNAVAPPEMKLLEHSIASDGYTQPIVAWRNCAKFEVVDGFHRNRVGKECKEVKDRIHGYLPITIINQERQERNDRIAATIRHNRARGKHRVEAMSDIVVELKRRNWSNARIGKELGMDEDEVLRLCQITGLVELFSDADFSQAWDAAIFNEEGESTISEEDILALDNDEETKNNNGRILHTWDKWECYPAGFYNDKPPDGMTNEEAEQAYAEFLADIDRFDRALECVTSKWVNSCEHYLTNERMNRIAWLGQAAMCYDTGVSSRFCGGYNLLTPEKQRIADEKALEWLNKWLQANGREIYGSLESAQSKTQPELY